MWRVTVPVLRDGYIYDQSRYETFGAHHVRQPSFLTYSNVRFGLFLDDRGPGCSPCP